MVRSLVIRQVFLLLEVSLAFLAVFAVLLVLGIIGNSKIAKPVEPPPDGVDDELTINIASAQPFDTYNALVTGGLFGDAGRWDPDVEPPPPPPPPEITELEDTKLNLRLTGTIASGMMNDPFASAYIADGDRKTPSKGYAIGNEVVDRVTLIEIYHREVIIMNARHAPAKKERLAMDDEGSTVPIVQARVRARKPGRSSAVSQRVPLKREEIQRDILTSYADIVNKVKPTEHRDASGKVVGITAGEISDIPLAKKLALEDGDVFTSVNNEKIDSVQKVMELTNKYRNAETLRIGILRNGKMKTITYSLQ